MTLERVVVRTPATSANIGPGFDSLGIALGLCDEFTFDRLESGPSRAITMDQDGKPSVQNLPTDESNLAVVAFDTFYSANHMPAPSVAVTCVNRIPIARGLGSSAAAIVAGVLAAEAMMGLEPDMQRRLNMAARIEGHPDNTAACLLGGVVAASLVATSVLWANVPLAAPLGAVVAVPDMIVSTRIARNVLPGNVLHSDAVFNVSRVALLVASLASGDYSNLRYATEDRLHQPYRASLAPGMADAIRAALEAGALGAYVSGAGPAIMAFQAQGADTAPVAKAMADAFARSRVQASILHLTAAAEGAQIVSGVK